MADLAERHRVLHRFAFGSLESEGEPVAEQPLTVDEVAEFMRVSSRGAGGPLVASVLRYDLARIVQTANAAGYGERASLLAAAARPGAPPPPLIRRLRPDGRRSSCLRGAVEQLRLKR